MTANDPLAALDALNAKEGPGDAGTADPRVTTVQRLAKLSHLDYVTVRKDEAKTLVIGVGALDIAVRAERARREAESIRQHRSKPPPAGDEIRWPVGYTMQSDGLYGPQSGDNGAPWIAARFDVLGKARDAAGESWGILLRWYDADGTEHRFNMPMSLTVTEPGRLEAELMQLGLRMAVDHGPRMMLRRALAEVQTEKRVRIAYQTGWHGTESAPAFLLPNGEVVGAGAEALVLHRLPADAARRCASKGTLDGWKNGVAALAKGNNLATFGVCVGLTGPLLKPAGEPGGGFHIAGLSKVGKTTMLKMGLSAWALPEKSGGAMRDWRSTANGLETVAEECTDALLPLDELHQANPAEVASVAYMIADGAGKARMTRDANAARRRTWRVCILSTGEHDLPTAVAKAGQTFPAGAEVRLPSIHVGSVAAVWPALHGRENVTALLADIHAGMSQHHGTAARAFIQCLVDDAAARGMDFRRILDTVRERFMSALPANTDPQVRDVARRFALVAAAGEMAIAWGILPWEAEAAETSAKAIFAAWLARRPAGTGAAEAETMLARVRGMLIQHGGSRFTELIPVDSGGWADAHPSRPVINRIGWRKSGKGKNEFLIPRETWISEICAPAMLDPLTTARTLVAHGYLRRGEGRNGMVNERLPGHTGTTRVYAVQAALLEEKTDAKGGTPT